jgi:hypothetical protein
MDKIWINKKKGEDKLIAIGNNCIYKVNPKADRVEQYTNDLKNGTVSDDVLSIPYSYIKNIQYQEGKQYIQVFFGQESEEYIRIKDDNKRNEIFKYFKDNIPGTAYQFEEYSAFKSGKKPMIAVILTSLLFAWTLYLSIQIELGYQYELVGGSGHSITGLVLALANLGVLKVVLIFGSLLGIGLSSMIRKMRNRPSVHDIVILRG